MIESNYSDSLTPDPGNSVSIRGHIFPIVLDDNGIPHHYATECANCGCNIAGLRDSLESCPNPQIHV